MQAIRSRDCRRLIEEFETEYLDSTNQWGIDSYWLLDRVGNKGTLKGFSITYNPLRGETDGQAERDEEWLEWDILRHPALTGKFLLFLDPLNSELISHVSSVRYHELVLQSRLQRSR